MNCSGDSCGGNKANGRDLSAQSWCPWGAAAKAAGRIAIVALWTVATIAHAAIIGVQNNGSVYSINETTGTATLLSTNTLFANGMARNSAGVLYAAGGLGAEQLKTINPTTGVMTAGPFVSGAGDIRGLAFSSGDVLYAIDNDNGGDLYTINVTTGAGTFVGNSAQMQALAFAPSGTLYGWNSIGGLFTINSATGAVTDVNLLVGSTASIQTLAFSGAGVAYAASQTDLYTVDLSTGVLTLVGSMAPATDIRGMEFIPSAPPAPGVALTPSPLAFGNQQVGITSAAQAITLQNIGSATLNITSIAASGDFAQTNTCGATLAPTASCAINVTFTPVAVGVRSGSISVSTNAVGSPHSVPLSGTGTAVATPPAVSLTPAGLAFGSVVVGSTTAGQTLALQNTGGTTLNISSIAASGDFAQTNNCGATLGPLATCAITVTFTPTVLGARTGALSVASNATGSPHSVVLSGTGAAVPPPLPAAEPIPTLSEWALILLSLAVVTLAVVVGGPLSRRR